MRLNREWLKSKDTNVTVARTACWNMCSTEGDKQYMFLNLMSLATEMCKTTKEPWAACMRAVLRQWLKERSNATNHDKASNV